MPEGNRHSYRHRYVLCLFWLLLSSLPADAQRRAPELVRLPKQATSPQLGMRPGGNIGPTGRESNLTGWLVLNGATFPNEEFPDLARTLRENYAKQGYSAPTSNVTQLPNMGVRTSSSGGIVGGMAICPSREICGGLVGVLAPFDLDSSL